MNWRNFVIFFGVVGIIFGVSFGYLFGVSNSAEKEMTMFNGTHNLICKEGHIAISYNCQKIDYSVFDKFGYDKKTLELYSNPNKITHILEICEKDKFDGRGLLSIFYNGTHHMSTITCKLQHIYDVCDMTQDSCSALPPFKKIILMP